MNVPSRTTQGKPLERALKHFLRPTPEFVQGWEHDNGRPAGSRAVFNPKTLKY